MSRKLVVNGDRASAPKPAAKPRIKKGAAAAFRDVKLVRPTVKPSVPRKKIVEAVRKVMDKYEEELV